MEFHANYVLSTSLFVIILICYGILDHYIGFVTKYLLKAVEF